MTKGKDFIPGEHDAKSWFKIMWQNGYIRVFLLGLVGIILELTNLDTCKDLLFGYNDPEATIWAILLLLIPWAICIIVTLLGFIKFWNYLKGKS